MLDNFTTKMTEALTKAQATSQPIINDSSAAPTGIKLDGSNYALWSQVVEMNISAKDKLGYINGDLPQPSETDPTFRKWRTENSVVKGWLINSMDHLLQTSSASQQQNRCGTPLQLHILMELTHHRFMNFDAG